MIGSIEGEEEKTVIVKDEVVNGEEVQVIYLNVPGGEGTHVLDLSNILAEEGIQVSDFV